MSLAGWFRTFALDDLLRWVSHRRRTGSLTLDGAEASTVLYLKDGRVISSSTTDPRFYFGQFLLAHTNLREAQLRLAFERQEHSRVYLGKNIYIKTLLGKILVEEGLLTEAEVARVLGIKAEESLLEALRWSDGSFRFEAGELPPEELVPIAIDTAEVVARWRVRADRWQQIRARIPSPNAVFRAGPASAARPPLNPTDARLLAALVRGRSLRELMLELHTTEFAVSDRAEALIASGLLELDREDLAPEPPFGAAALAPGGADALLERGLELFDQRAYADTVVAARRALRDNPAHPEARRLLERSERELTDSFYARLFTPDDVPVLRVAPSGPEAAGLSPEERFLLERVNGVWNMRALIQLSPLKEVDALAVFKRLIERGFIGLKRSPPAQSGS